MRSSSSAWPPGLDDARPWHVWHRALRSCVIYVLPWFVFVPYYPVAGTPLSLDDLLPVAVVGLGVVVGLGSTRPRFEAVTALLLGLAVVNLAATLASDGGNGDLIRSAARGFGRVTFFAALMWTVLIAVRDRGDVERTLQSTALAGAAQGLFAVWSYWTDYHGPAGIGVAPTPEWTTLRRVHGTFAVVDGSESVPVSANFLSAYLMVTCLVAVGLALKATSVRGRALWYGAAALCIAGIGVTFGRSSLAGVAVGGLVLALLARRTSIVLAVVALCGLAVALVPGLSKRLTSFDNDRLALYHAGLQIALDHPALGVGDGNYLRVMDSEPEYRVTPFGGATSTPHNSVLLAAAHTGWVGAALLGFAVLFALARMFLLAWWSTEPAQRQLLSALAAACAAFCLQDQTNNLLFVPKTAVFFWLFVALSVVVGRGVRPLPHARPASHQ